MAREHEQKKVVRHVLKHGRLVPFESSVRDTPAPAPQAVEAPVAQAVEAPAPQAVEAPVAQAVEAPAPQVEDFAIGVAPAVAVQERPAGKHKRGRPKKVRTQ